MMEKDHANNNQKKSRLSIFNIKVNFKAKNVTIDKEHHFVMITGHKEDITILNSYAPNNRVSSIRKPESIDLQGTINKNCPNNKCTAD